MTLDCYGSGGIGALTSPRAGGCGLRSPSKRVHLADRIKESRLDPPGQSVNVRLDGVPSRDPQGRHYYVTAIEMRGSVKVTTGASNSAVPGYNMLAKFSEISLEDVSGWGYLAGVSGCDLVDDVFHRNHRLSRVGVGCDGLGENVGAGDNEVPVDLYFPLVSMGQANPSIRGALPIAAIKDRGDGALRFRVADFTDVAGAIAGVTDGGFSGVLEVWLHMVALPAPFVTAPWQLESYTKVDISGTLRHADRAHEYVAMRPRGYDTNASIEGYTGATFEVGNETLTSGLSGAELARRSEGFYTDDVFAIAEDLYGGTLIVLDRARTKAAMPAGPIAFNFASRVDDETRFLHRTVASQGQHARRAREMARAMGAPSGMVARPITESGARTFLEYDAAADLILEPRRAA